MEDFFLRLYRSCYLKTRASRRSRQRATALLAEVAEILGQEKADELGAAANTICEEEGLQSFIEGFRYGMTLVLERL